MIFIDMASEIQESTSTKRKNKVFNNRL